MDDKMAEMRETIEVLADRAVRFQMERDSLRKRVAALERELSAARSPKNKAGNREGV